jgi:hypothetical protein
VSKKNLTWVGANALLTPKGYLLVLPVPPSGNSAYRTYKGRVISSKEWRDYQNDMKTFAMVKRIRKIAAPQEIGLTIRWYREQQKGDLTNREKTVEDALQGTCYDNDAQVSRKMSSRFDVFNGPPRIEVQVDVIS